ncbi:MAG: TVP38/TMEM64 family protein [Planctomycetes bacterium]|nr:TVP38/TMEM64 family protein [Planctomycetota bacterium]
MSLQTRSLKSVTARRAALIRWVSAGAMFMSALLFVRLLPIEQAVDNFEQWVERLGMWGPLALAAVYVVAVVLLVPGTVLTLAAGAIYGLAAGLAISSLASTTGAALAFLIARYAARENIRRRISASPKLLAVDRAIGERGWKIVALLRLSPAVPFNLQNYLYGVTAIRFWPCVLASWVAMLPATFLVAYLGSLGRSAAAGGSTSTGEWILRGAGLAATIAVTLYITHIARKALYEQTEIDEAAAAEALDNRAEAGSAAECRWPWGTLLLAVCAAAMLAGSVWASVEGDRVTNAIKQWLR